MLHVHFALSIITLLVQFLKSINNSILRTTTLGTWPLLNLPVDPSSTQSWWQDKICFLYTHLVASIDLWYSCFPNLIRRVTTVIQSNSMCDIFARLMWQCNWPLPSFYTCTLHENTSQIVGTVSHRLAFWVCCSQIRINVCILSYHKGSVS